MLRRAARSIILWLDEAIETHRELYGRLLSSCTFVRDLIKQMSILV